MKSRHKITLLFTLLVMAILIVVSISVYYFSALERQDIFKKRLRVRANNNAQIFSYVTDTGHVVLNRFNASSREPLPNRSVEIFDVKGKPLYKFNTTGNNAISISDKLFDEVLSNGERYFKRGNREALAVYYTEESNGIVVVVAAYDPDGWRQLGQLRQIFIVSLLIGTAIALVAGHVFSRQLLRPVAQIISEVNDISSYNLSHRIRTTDTQDELNQLANTFNELLDRLQESFTSQSRFISNASHELSTPLTSISSQLQVTLQRDRSTDEYQQVMQSILEDVMQMRALTKTLLEIAKTGSQGNIELDEIRIDEILFKVMGDIRKIDMQYQVELTFTDSPERDDGFLVFGNSDLLYIAVKNVVENGCKYSPDHTATVNLSYKERCTIIEVRSIGEGIAAEEMEQIFQPFYRSRAAAGTTGFGLGLALAKRIIGLHKGSLSVISRLGGETVFTITLPTLNRN